MEDNVKPFSYSAEWYASEYHRIKVDGIPEDPGPGQYEARDRACIAASGIKDGDKVLVPGCSGGNNISLLRAMFRDLLITGFDWSSTAVTYCSRTFPNCSFTVAGVNEFVYTCGQFDRVLALDFTEHLSLIDYANFLALCFTALRPGGTVSILPGFTLRPEHINLMHHTAVAQHLSQFGFRILAIGPQWVVGEKPCG